MYSAPIWLPTPHHSLFRNSKLSKTVPSETKILPVQDHPSLISSPNHAGDFQPNNPSHDVVTSLSVIRRNLQQTLQSRFLHCVAPYLSNGILPPLIIGPPSSPSKLIPVFDSKSLLSHNRILQIACPQITPK